MKTMNTQRGMTLTSFLTVLIVVGFFLYIGMKLFPMYQEYYAVKTSMKALAREPGSADPVKAQEPLVRFDLALDVDLVNALDAVRFPHEELDVDRRLH